jgi:hypothetical protein
VPSFSTHKQCILGNLTPWWDSKPGLLFLMSSETTMPGFLEWNLKTEPIKFCFAKWCYLGLICGHQLIIQSYIILEQHTYIPIFCNLVLFLCWVRQSPFLDCWWVLKEPGVLSCNKSRHLLCGWAKLENSKKLIIITLYRFSLYENISLLYKASSLTCNRFQIWGVG